MRHALTISINSLIYAGTIASIQVINLSSCFIRINSHSPLTVTVSFQFLIFVQELVSTFPLMIYLQSPVSLSLSLPTFKINIYQSTYSVFTLSFLRGSIIRINFFSLLTVLSSLLFFCSITSLPLFQFLISSQSHRVLDFFSITCLSFFQFCYFIYSFLILHFRFLFSRLYLCIPLFKINIYYLFCFFLLLF